MVFFMGLYRITLILALLAPCMDAAFGYRKSKTVNSSQVAGGPHSDFNMWVGGTDADLAVTGSGGKVQDAQGDDIQFFSNLDCATGKLAWDRKYYVSTTGAHGFWVRISSIDTGSVIYMCYGDAAETTNESDPATVWGSPYLTSLYLSDGSSMSSQDSSVGNNDLNSTGSFAAQGGSNCKLGACASNSGLTNSYMTMATSPMDGLTAFTVDMWIYMASGGSTPEAWWSDWSSTQTLFRMEDSASFRMIVGWSDASSADTAAWSGSGFAANTWTKVTVTYDGTTLRTYSNGVAGPTVAASSKTVKNHTSSNTQRVGGGATASEFNWNGRLDQPVLLSSARSANWVLTEFRNQNDPASFYATGSEVSLGSAAIAGSVIVIQ